MIERQLSKSQRRVILALMRERDLIVKRANEEVAEINAAIEEQAQLLRQAFDLPEGNYQFEGDTESVFLRKAPPEQLMDALDEVMEVADEVIEIASEAMEALEANEAKEQA